MGGSVRTEIQPLGGDRTGEERMTPASGAGRAAAGGYGGGPSKAQTSELVSRFLREARVTGQLEHPSIVAVDELGERARGMGFRHVAAGPLVRSSYRASELFVEGLKEGG